MLDFHNHLMPAVDDGAGSIEESRQGLSTMTAQGVTSIITTPHIRGSLTRHPHELGMFLHCLDDAWERLKLLAAIEFPRLRIERGVEVMLDIPAPDFSDPRLRLAGTEFILVEFPYMTIPPHSTQAIRDIADGGWIPVIAHPERYSNIPERYDLVGDWRDAGARIQVNEGSLLGYYGAGPRRIAWRLLEHACVDYLSSDYHSRGKCPASAAAEALMQSGGESQLNLLTQTNPERLLQGVLPLPVPPLFQPKASVWSRVFARKGSA